MQDGGSVGAILDTLNGWTVELKWREGVTPLCPNPVVIKGASNVPANLVVWEADEQGRPVENVTYGVPLDDIEEVSVL